MPLKGDFAALEAKKKKIEALKKASAEIMRKAAPKFAPLIGKEFQTGTDPYGKKWQPKKDGGQPFAGSDGANRVKVKAVSATRIRASVTFPMHFHNAGTKGGGKKSKKAQRKKLRSEGYTRAAIKGIIKEREASRGMRLPKREIIPSVAQGIPKPWDEALRSAAREVLAPAGATEVR